jgi:cytochrome c
MDNRTNTIAGWVLGAAIVALGATLVTGEMFHNERPDKMGYPIAGVKQEAEGAAAQPVGVYLAQADAGAGEAASRRCAACHTFNQGGANGLGPNLWGRMGQPIASIAGYNYSEPLRSHGGNWTWENMDAWLASPRTFAAGTKMTFAGISDPQERANLMFWMNQQGSNIPLPAAPQESDTPGENAAQASDAPAAGDQGTPQPILNEAAPGTEATGRSGGPAAPGAGRGSQPAPTRPQGR